MPEWGKLLVGVAIVFVTALLTMREAAIPNAAGSGGPQRRRRTRQSKPGERWVRVPRQPLPQPKPPLELPIGRPVIEQEAGAQRDWLLDSLPLEPAGASRERAAGAGRLLIGITGMAIAGALAVLGISRAFSALFDRLLR